MSILSTSLIHSNCFLICQVPLNGPKLVIAFWLNETTLNISWSPLSLLEARGFITHYTVSLDPLNYETKSNSKGMLRRAVFDNHNTVLVGGLDPKQDYVVNIAASTIAGESSNNSNVTVLAFSEYI